jgi:hypothetical protein
MFCGAVNRLKMRRVAVISHALMPDYTSTKFIEKALMINGRKWPESTEDPGFIKWLSFPILAPPGSGGYQVWTDVYVIPVFASRFREALKGDEAFLWTSRVAGHVINEAAADGVPLWIGWGGMTKNATYNGKKFLYEYRRWMEGLTVYTTHGDAGTAVLTISALQKLKVGDGSRIAIIGADCQMGSILARAIPAVMSPAEIVLVDEPDDQDAAHKLQRLYKLKMEAESAIGDDVTMVSISQDKRHACLARQIDTVIIVSPGTKIGPEDIPVGSLVIDMTIPPSCREQDDWTRHWVLHAGCGQFANADVVPDGFTLPDGRLVEGTLELEGASPICNLIWGCAGEAIAAAMFDHRLHEVDPHVSMKSVERVRDWFARLGLQPQPPVSFGREFPWDEIRRINPGNFMGWQL